MNETQMNNILSRASQLMNDERFNSIVESTKATSDGSGNIISVDKGGYTRPSDDSAFYNDIKDYHYLLSFSFRLYDTIK